MHFLGTVLIGDDLGRFDDVLEEIAQRVTRGDPGQVRSDAAAGTVEAMAGRAAGRVEQGSTILKVAASDSACGHRERLFYTVGSARPLGCRELGVASHRFERRERFHRVALGRIADG